MLRFIEGLMWIATIVAALIAAFLLLLAAAVSGAPQQGALAAIAAALCIVPYVIARALQALLMKNS